MNEAIYHADRRTSGRQVFVTREGETKALRPRTDIVCYSTNGHDWGFMGGPAAQLAVDILADYFGDDQQAYDLHHVFQFVVIRRAEFQGFRITADQILDTVRDAAMLNQQVE